MERPVVAVWMREPQWEHVLAPAVVDAFSQQFSLVGPQGIDAADLGPARVLFTSWGSPRWDSALFARMPSLELILYAAGSIRPYVDDSFWARGVRVSSAWRLNAVPVIEFTVAQIMLSLKDFWRRERSYRAARARLDLGPPTGGFGSTVGLVSLGVIGRGVAERLSSYDLRVLAYDPFGASPQAEPASLERVFEESDVVSLHTPWLPETEGLVTEALLRSMKPGATLINTSRGAIVDEKALVAVLAERPDLTAVLDVTWPEPPVPDSPLWTLPNAVLSPHIAGAMGAETTRFGLAMVEEARRWLAKEPLQHEVTPELFARMA